MHCFLAHRRDVVPDDDREQLTPRELRGDGATLPDRAEELFRTCFRIVEFGAEPRWESPSQHRQQHCG